MATPRPSPTKGKTWTAGWRYIRRRSDGLWLAGKSPTKGGRLGAPTYQFSNTQANAVKFGQRLGAEFMWRRISRRFPKDQFEIIFEAKVK